MRKFAIDKHPNKQLIVHDIVSGVYSDEAIASRYNLSGAGVVATYRKKALPEMLRLMAYRDTDGLIAAITQNLVRVDKMLEGLEKWAVDPDNPDAFTMDPRASEISVIYTKSILQGKKILRIRLKENLQDVIDRLFSEDEKIGIRLETHKADQRIVLLKAMDTMRKNLELLIEARDALTVKDNDDSSYRANLEELMQVIQEALRPYPEAMAALTKAVASAAGRSIDERSDTGAIEG